MNVDRRSVIGAVAIVAAAGILTLVPNRGSSDSNPNSCESIKAASTKQGQRTNEALDRLQAIIDSGDVVLTPGTGALVGQVQRYNTINQQETQIEYNRVRLDALHQARTAGQLITGHPDCFDPLEVSKTQTLLKQLDAIPG
jgi:hypothetical protein